MRKAGLTAVLVGVVLAAAGCTKTGVVKMEDPLAEAKAKAPVAAVQQPAPGPETAAVPERKPVPDASEMDAKAKANADRTLRSVHFDYDSHLLNAEARETLNRNLPAIREKAAQGKVVVEGHCDERGSDDYNLALGEKRAVAAKKYLVTCGVPEDRLATISYGKEKPAATGHDEGSWAKNRRDEFVFVGK